MNPLSDPPSMMISGNLFEEDGLGTKRRKYTPPNLDQNTSATSTDTQADAPLIDVVGKTIVSSAIIDRVAAKIGRRLVVVAADMSYSLAPLFRAVNLHFPLSRPLLT